MPETISKKLRILPFIISNRLSEIETFILKIKMQREGCFSLNIERRKQILSPGQTAHKTQYIRFAIFYLFMNQKIQDHSATLISILLCGWWSELVVYIQSHSVLCLEEAPNPVICAYGPSVPQCFLEEINNAADGNTGWMHLWQAELALKASQSPTRLLSLAMAEKITSQKSLIPLDIFGKWHLTHNWGVH